MNEFWFDPDKHEYGLDETILPSVTQLVDAGNLSPFHKDPNDDPTFYMDRGRKVHKAVELHEQGILNEKTLDETTGPRLDGWKKWKRKTGAKVLLSERPMYDARYLFAGTVDAVVMWNGRLTIIDIKCGLPYAVYGIQLAGYERLVRANRSHLPFDVSAISDRISLHLNGRGSYEIMEHQDLKDDDVFKACLEIYRWKERAA